VVREGSRLKPRTTHDSISRGEREGLELLILAPDPAFRNVAQG
jgi:hypothetical protein